MMRNVILATATAVSMAVSSRAVADDFAAWVVIYAPAPGQFVNDPGLNDPTYALGPPLGGGTRDGNDVDVVTLGGFGGFVVLQFDHRVADDPLNAFGMDAIVFGNAFWVGGNPQSHWAECATIEISKDANGNGISDDPWFLIPGSHLTPPDDAPWVVTWDDEAEDATYPPDDASWIPPGSSGVWETIGYELPAATFGPERVANPSANAAVEGIFGYADYTPTLVLGDLNADNVVDDPGLMSARFYTVPDDSFTVGITRGSGGGDAFDIAWAVDPGTGQPANLDSFDFIRITTAVTTVSPVFGERSPEIDSVADVRHDPFGDADGDHDIDLRDAAWLQGCFALRPGDLGGAEADACAALDRQPDDFVGASDFSRFVQRMAGPRY
ncbi:MAG: hypothetical protein AABZ12_14650 [Planctomycetota bacterium]